MQESAPTPSRRTRLTGPPRGSTELTPFWRFIGAWGRPLLNAWLHPEIRGAEHVPATGPVVIAPNHTTDLDPLAVGVALWQVGRAPRFLAKASLWKVPALSFLLRSTGMIPVERGARGAEALEGAGELVGRGAAVIVYPEGTLTREPDLWPMRGKTGVVRIALAAGAPIVPTAQWGAHEVMPRWSKSLRFFARKRIVVEFGAPVDLTEWTSLGRPLTTAEVAAATDRVMDEVTRLVERVRGETAPAVRWDPSDHGQSEFGRP